MFRRLVSSLTDELAGLSLLYGVMRHRGRPPRSGPMTDAPAADLFSGDPARAFGPAPAAVDLRAAAVPLGEGKGDREVGRVAGCGDVTDFAFPSSDVTGEPANDAVRGRVWRSAAPGGFPNGRRCVLALDGIVQAGFGNLRTFADECCPAATDLATVDLPFNHRRTPAGYRPGQLILGGDLPHVVSVLRQAVRDTAAAFRSLCESGDYPGGVALAGISFGGWTVLQTAALIGSVWPDIQPPRWVCGVCPATDLLSELTSGGTIVRAARRNLGLSPADRGRLAGVGESLRPAAFPPPLPAGRVILHAADYDRFVSNPAIERLAAAWGGTLTWHATGHMGLAATPHYLRKVAGPWAADSLWEPIRSGNRRDR